MSENPAKVTNPGIKKLMRVYGPDGKAFADLIALESDRFPEGEPLELFDPVDTWKRVSLTDYTIRELHVPIFKNGELVYNSPSLQEICDYAREEMDSFWDQYKRLLNPHRYKVDLSESLWMLKQSMLKPH